MEFPILWSADDALEPWPLAGLKNMLERANASQR